MEYEINRLVDDVIDEILPIIPLQEKVLINLLNEFKNSLWNLAPEVRQSSYIWIKLCNLLNENISVFDQDWKIIIKKIINKQD